MYELTQISEIERVAPDSTAATTFTLAAGTTDVNSSAIDLQASNGAHVIVLLGALAASATYTASIEQSATGSGGWTALGNLSIAVSADTDDNKVLAFDVTQPTQRYIRVVSDRGTGNTTIDGIVCYKFRRGQAVTQGTTVEAVDIQS
jgi:hypothetical protein